jgi:hypothetical protein
MPRVVSLPVVSEIDIWCAAALMLWWYGDTSEAESKRRVEELAADGHNAGVAVWRRIISAIEQLKDTTHPGPMH